VAVIRFIITLPFRLLALAIIVPVKLALGLVKLSVRSTFFALRSSILSFVAGIGAGWFLTSTPTGRQLVDQVRDLVSGTSGPVDDDQLAAQVRTELASSTRTWHLPQPQVAVSAGIVTLTGEAPHDTGRTDLEEAARSVRGVVSVLNNLTVAAAAPEPVTATATQTDTPAAASAAPATDPASSSSTASSKKASAATSKSATAVASGSVPETGEDPTA
jgi:osmotically-inducible protein OsmY